MGVVIHVDDSDKLKMKERRTDQFFLVGLYSDTIPTPNQLLINDWT